MISKKAHRRLRGDLVNGSAKILQDRIFQKHGIFFTTAYINYVLDPKDKRFNDMIIDEAIALQNEIRQKRAKREASILQS